MTNSELASLVYLREACLFKKDFQSFMISNDSLISRCSGTDFGIIALLAKATVLHHIYRDTPTAMSIISELFELQPDSVDVSSVFWAIVREDTLISIPKPSIESRHILPPQNLRLDQNYPNPFNANTTFKFAIPNSGHVLLSVFNILGRKVATLIDQELDAGGYSKSCSLEGYPSGLYFYQIFFEGRTITRRMYFMQ